MLNIAKYIVVLTVCGGFYPCAALAANLDVCETCGYQTINAAVSAAANGDTIRVAEGDYQENVSFNDSKSLRLEGGYNSTFTARNPDLYPTVILAANVNYYNVGDMSFDGLTINGNESSGLFVWSPNSAVSVTNCKIQNNLSSGLYVLSVKELTVTGNSFIGNYDPSDSYFTAAIYVSDNTRTHAEITDNSITGSLCQYCYGIYLTNSSGNDVVARNTIQGNSAGILMQSTSGTASLVEWNTIAHNLGNGMTLSGGNLNIRHNTIFNNSGHGANYTSPGAALISRNVFSGNGQGGLSLNAFLQGSVAPVVRHNIFSSNETNGLSISGSNGWGTTNIYPAVEYNAFYGNAYGELIHSVDYPWSFEDEEPGVYGELNATSWSNYNIRHDPGFVDAENGDFTLRPDSFLIDAGDPNDSYSGEPAPNGGRVNIGLYGGTGQAESSPDAPQLDDLVAWIAGPDIMISLDAGTSSVSNWLILEYFDGASYVAVPASAISGDQLVQGYRGARLTTGLNRVVTWHGGTAQLPSDEDLRTIRISLQRGADTISATADVCSHCESLNNETPTPTAIPTTTSQPTATPQPTLTPQPTSAPTLIPSVLPTIAPTKAPTARPTKRQRKRATPTATPRPKAKPRKTPRHKARSKRDSNNEPTSSQRP